MNRIKLGVTVQNILALAPEICALLSDSFFFKKTFLCVLGCDIDSIFRKVLE